MTNTQERDEVIFREPIKKQNDVRVRIEFAEGTEWRPKDAVKEMGEVADSYKACKLTLAIVDPSSVQCEREDSIPKTIIEESFNVQKYPYVNKKTGTLAWMNRGKLFDLEGAFGFEPCFVGKDGEKLEPVITRTGNKVAPKVEGVARVLNPDFVQNYFHEDMTVNPTNWIGQEILADVNVKTDDQFGDKNVIARYKKPAAL